MKRNNIAKYIQKDGTIFLNKNSNMESLFLSQASDGKIIVDEGVCSDILIGDLSDNLNLNLELKNDSSLSVKGVIRGNDKNIEINGNIAKNATISLYFLDFSSGKVVIDGIINCLDEGSSATWKMASLSAKNDNKKIAINIEHLTPNSNGLVDNYGVCKDNGKLEFAGANHIKKGAKKTQTRQSARIMLLDKESDGIAKPILKIDESDVIASHAGAIGQVNEDQLFYLESRGLKENEARELIVLGYFKPILQLFDEDENQKEIAEQLEKKIANK